jgi:alanine racemase
MLNTARALIDLGALRHNLSVVRALCPHSRIMAMVKADAYGHGLLPVAQALREADGLAVARLEEALQLRRAGVSQRLLLLGSLLDAGDLEICASERIDVEVHDEATAELVCRRRGSPLNVWLKLDSGMHRLGLDPALFRAVDAWLRRTPTVAEIVHMTHFACADDPSSTHTARQLDCFRQAHGDSDAAISVANSAALIAQPEARGDWVRPGIMLYGDNPLADSHPLPLQPVMTLCARVLAIREIAPGEGVGYGARWTSERPSRIATLGIGYGDGYPRHAASGTPVLFSGQRAPLAGRVSMDSITVDITDIDGVRVGDEAILWGEGLPAAEVARHADTISYELFTSIGSRVSRDYLHSS